MSRVLSPKLVQGVKKVSLILEESEQLNPIVAGSSKIPS